MDMRVLALVGVSVGGVVFGAGAMAGGSESEHVRVDAKEALVVAHRGASGRLPEHTLEAYSSAFFMGADVIEPDVVATKDGGLVCFHDLYLEKVTDVETVYPDRAREDGRWYVIDFDVAELKALSVTGRDGVNGGWEGMQIPTFGEMLDLVSRLNEESGRSVGVIPEIKKPGFYAEHGVDLASMVIETIDEREWDPALVTVQCFDVEVLERVSKMDGMEYSLLLCAPKNIDSDRLDELASFVDVIAPNKKIIEKDPTLVTRAHAAGIKVIPYTFLDDVEESSRFYHEYGVDGMFTNFPLTAMEARDAR